MTQPAWPFQLVHAPSYPTDGVPTAAELNLLQEQVAVAADGRVWGDYAHVLNWPYGPTAPSGLEGDRGLIYSPASGTWFSFGSDGDGQARSFDGGKTWISSQPFGAGSTKANPAAAANPNGHILVGRDGVSTVAQVWHSTNNGATYTARTIASGLSGNCSIKSIAWSQARSWWVVGVVNGSGQSAIYTSPDAITWTLRLAFGANGALQRPALNADGSIILLEGSFNWQRSADGGETWATQALPDTPYTGGFTTTWVPGHGQFVLLDFSSGSRPAYRSSDGATWQATGSSQKIEVPGAAAAFRRALVITRTIEVGHVGLRLSLDAGSTWINVPGLDMPNVGYLAEGNGQLCAIDGAAPYDHYASLRASG